MPWKLSSSAVERRDRLDWRADVVAEDGRQQVGGGADDGDVLPAPFRGRTPLFLSRTMLSSAALSEVARLRRGAGVGEGNLVERIGALRIEEAELEARGVEALGGLGD